MHSQIEARLSNKIGLGERNTTCHLLRIVKRGMRLRGGFQKKRAPHNIMAYDQPLFVVGCMCRFVLYTQQGIGLGCAIGQ
jgi:hypothetical protein